MGFIRGSLVFCLYSEIKVDTGLVTSWELIMIFGDEFYTIFLSLVN